MTTTRSVRPRLTAVLLAMALCTVAVTAQQQGSLQADPATTTGVVLPDNVLEGDTIPDIIISPNNGSAVSRVLDGATLGELGSGFPFGAGFSGGVRMAAGDLTGDGVADIVAAMGPGGGLVTLLNGIDASSIGGGFPFGPGFGGGVNVAVGDFNGDGRLDIVTAQATGGGVVTVFNGVNYAPIFTLQPFGASYTGGVNVATGDVNADGVSDVVTAQANGGLVSIVDGATRTVILSGVPFGGGGVFVAAGDVNGDGRADVMAAPGTGAGPVLVYDVNALAAITTFMPYGAGYTGGVRLAATDLNGDGRVEILTVPGPGGAPALKVFDGATFANTHTVAVYPPAFTNGVFVAAPAATGLRFTSAAAATFTAGAAGSFTVQVAGSPRATSITQTGALPAGVTFTNNGDGTATLAGTPGAATGGAHPFTISASNGVGAPIAQAFTLTVNEAPAITSAAAISFSLGAAGTFTITSTGYPQATVAVTGALPAGVTFTNNGNGTGTLSGTPEAGTSGAYPLTVSAGNGVGTAASQNFVLTIDSAPVFTSAAATTFVAGTPGTFSITTSASPAVTTITRTGALPAGVSFTDHGNGTATLAGTPGAATGGTYALTFTASNGGASAPQSFTLTVQQAPAITSANTTTFAQGAPGTFTVTTTGFPAAGLVLTGALPGGVTFTDHGDGTATVAGTPAAGTGGSYPLSISASNGIGTAAVQAFTLGVSAAPAITSANATTFVAGQAGSFTVTTTGGPTPAVITRTGALPTGVTFTDNGNGTATLAGVPGAATGGVYPLTITANNGVGTPAAQSFTLTVNQAPAITSAAAATFTVNTAGTFTVTTTGFPAATVGAAGALPTGVTFTNNGNGTGTIAGTPLDTAGSPFTLTITATNAAGAATPQSFTLTVNTGAPPVGTNDTFSNGVGNTQYSVGAGSPSTPAVAVAGSVLTNDSGTAPLTAGPASIATTNGGQVTMASNGSFLYTPAAGFGGPSDTFTYTVTDGSGGTDTAVVTINMSGVVWYVDAAAGSGGDGRSHSPFNAMPAAAAAAQSNQIIYVHAGSPAGDTVLKANQTLWGAGATYTLNGLTIPASTVPILQGTVTLANSVALNAVNVNGGAGPAIAGTGLSGTETLTAVSIVGGTSGLNLTGVSGSFTMTGGPIIGVSGADVLLSGGAGTVNISAPITNDAGRSIDIQNRTGGTVTFSGVILDSGSGIFLNNNTGATIAFTGGMALSTGSADAFTATGGGTVTATQNNTSILNTLATTTGTALNVTNTTIGAAGLTFRSISAGTTAPSAGVGIVLNNTGANAGLTVIGNGASPLLPTGGTIRFKSGPDGSTTSGIGIYLNNTRSVSLNWMQLNDFDNSAIVGRNVNGFTMANTVIDGVIGTSAGAVEGPLVFGLPNPAGVNGLTGVNAITDSLISGGVEHNVQVYNQSGTMSLAFTGTVNANGCQITENSSTTGADGLVVRAADTATASVTVTRCRFRNIRERAVSAIASESSNLSVDLQLAEVLHMAQGADGFVFSNSGDSVMTAIVNDSLFEEFTGTGISVGQAPGNASSLSSLRATITNNRMYPQEAATLNRGIVAQLSSTVGHASQARLLIQNNLVWSYGSLEGILVSSVDPLTTPDVDLTLLDNHIDLLDDINGVTAITLRATQGANLCANVLNNVTHHPSTLPGAVLRAEQANGATFRLERGAATLGTPADAVLVTNQHPFTGVEVVGSLTVIENNTCQLPSAP